MQPKQRSLETNLDKKRTRAIAVHSAVSQFQQVFSFARPTKFTPESVAFSRNELICHEGIFELLRTWELKRWIQFCTTYRFIPESVVYCHEGIFELKNLSDELVQSKVL